jgi:CheY-like chemotaxis protein
VATILVVDDEEAIRKLIAVILQSAGHVVVSASNGVEAVALFRSSPDEFDLILTDLRMPVMDGHQLVTLVRRTSPDTKIICMSGYADDPIPARTEFLPKPFLPDALRERVDKLLEQG